MQVSICQPETVALAIDSLIASLTTLNQSRRSNLKLQAKKS